jgi:hypothetical protein
MDPALREYLDRMCEDTAALTAAFNTRSDAILNKQELMSNQIAS